MPNIISGSDIIGWLEDSYEIGLPRTSLRRARRDARGNKREARAARVANRGSRALADAVASERNLGQPATFGTDLIASGQRRQPFGLGSVTLTDVNPTGILQQTTQRPMQPLAVIVNALYRPAAGTPIPGGFLTSILDIKMGTASQLAGIGEVPADYFRPDTIQSLLTFTPVGPGVSVSMSVAGAGLAAGDELVVSASMLCVVAEQ